MTEQEKTDSTPLHYMPTMTQDYSRISDTAKAVSFKVLPKIIIYLQSIASQIAGTNSETSFTIADYGAADGINSSELFHKIIEQIHTINNSVKIRLVYIDIADQSYFDRFWENSNLSQLDHVEAEYIKRSFYEPFPEIAGQLNLGFSSTSVHWLDAENTDSGFFHHPVHIQANQLPELDRRKFIEKWQKDWRVFFHERSAELVKGGALFFANLTNLGNDEFPASAGYEYLRDVCHDLCRAGRISAEEMNAIFVPDYFATPEEMKSLLLENDLNQIFTLQSHETMTVPCAYFSQMGNRLDDRQTKARLAETLAHVVRAWSESSIKTGLSPDNKNIVKDIYQRLGEKFYENPRGLPYQYCLLELLKK
jgi:hypothetical protein